MSNDAQRLLAAIPIESYIQRFVPLKQKGANLWGLCPFHSEKTPSFSVSPSRSIFHCFGCGKGGNLISFVMEYDKVTFPEALGILSDYSGIPLEERFQANPQAKEEKDLARKVLEWVYREYRKALPGSPALAYLVSRGVNEKTIEHFGLGYVPPGESFLEQRLSLSFSLSEKPGVVAALTDVGVLGERESGGYYQRFFGRLLFPIYNTEGKLAAFGGRILESRENTAKYINSPESKLFHKKEVLFHLSHAREAIRTNGYCVIVEGYFDVVGLYQIGIENVVAPLGTAFTASQVKLLRRFTDKVVLFLDSDTAGVDAAYRSLSLLREGGINAHVVVQNSKEKTDPFDIALRDGIEAYTLIDSAISELDFFLWYFFRHKNDISQIGGKRSAIKGFFDEVKHLTSEVDRVEYLKSAASVLGLDTKVLQKDFSRYITGDKTIVSQSAAPASDANKSVEKAKQRREREVLYLFLKFPELWTETAFLKKISFDTASISLLFYFFHERIQSGEVWDFDRMGDVMHILEDPGLESEVAGLLIEFSGFDNITLPSARIEVERFVVQKEIDHLLSRREALQKKLQAEERLPGGAPYQIATELTDLNARIKREEEKIRFIKR